MSTEEHKALVRRFEEAVWNERNPARVDEFFAESHLFRAAGSPPLDREGHRQMIAHFQDAFPDGRNTSEALLAEGDTVVNAGRSAAPTMERSRASRRPASR